MGKKNIINIKVIRNIEELLIKNKWYSREKARETSQEILFYLIRNAIKYVRSGN